MQKKNVKRFDNNYRQYKDMVNRTALRIVKNYHVAEEVSQEVFMKFYYHLDEVTDDMIRPWLIRITKNQSIDYLRKSKELLTEHETLFLLKMEQVSVRKSDMLTGMIKRDFLRKVLNDVKVNNESWYELLILLCCLNEPQIEAAKELNISLDVLRAKLHRARVWIRKRYGQEFENLIN